MQVLTVLRPENPLCSGILSSKYTGTVRNPCMNNLLYKHAKPDKYIILEPTAVLKASLSTSINHFQRAVQLIHLTTVFLNHIAHTVLEALPRLIF